MQTGSCWVQGELGLGAQLCSELLFLPRGQALGFPWVWVNLDQRNRKNVWEGA